ncbi:MAG: hypothetical protein BIFFINMI_00834 [Phycisphaerae bacterium]|nr:hypothetical protein [Phycisphaerae bacterium]
MQVDERIRELIAEVLRYSNRSAPAMANDALLFGEGIGLESLDFATLVVRLEQELGHDPFRDGTAARLPRTLGELVAIYQAGSPDKAAES